MVDGENEYRIKTKTGEYNLCKFINSLDYSLDLIKLREVYTKVYRNTKFSFFENNKEYSPFVINVTFKYSVKAYNRQGDGVFVKFGYSATSDELKDNILIRDGVLIAVRIGAECEEVIDESILGDYFKVKDNKYCVNKNETLYSLSEIRTDLYKNGFKSNGSNYIRFKRSSGSSRVGKCLFIDEKLYPQMHKWEMCGLKIPKNKKTDLAALEAYIALTLSSIIDTIDIYPENFLIVDDYKSVFKDNVVATRLGRDGWLKTKQEVVDVSNSIWDGQSLMDRSLFGKYRDKGMLLLRARFFKSCCFNTNIQQFFKDNGITDISQLNGITTAQDLSDIKIITTPNSIKYLKFGSISEWLDNMESTFGVVKYEKPTHFFNGKNVQTHYQLINTLQLSQDDIDAFLKESLEYLTLIKKYPEVLRNHIEFKISCEPKDNPITSKNAIIYKLLGINDRFANTKMYKDFRNDVISSLTKYLRKGKVLINGNYSTICGNPYEMLLNSIGKFDGTPYISRDCVYSKRFDYGKALLASRSPHVTMGNILLVANEKNEYIEKYFNFTNEIVCINSINSNILMRLSGSDFDSDTMLLTDNEVLIKAAQKNYDKFGVPTNMVSSNRIQRRYNCEEQADLDIKTSVNKIGEIVNLSQELNTKFWDNINKGQSFEENSELYNDIAKLDTLSMIEIDKAKKETVVDSGAEIVRIRNKYIKHIDGKEVKPNFLGKIAKYKGYYSPSSKAYIRHMSAMDYLEHSINVYKSPIDRDVKISFTYILDSNLYDVKHVWYSQVYRVVGYIREYNAKIKSVWHDISKSGDEKYMLAKRYYDELVIYVSNLKMSDSTMFFLLTLVEQYPYSDIKKTMFRVLFAIPQSNFYNLIKSSASPIGVLRYDDNGDINIYGTKYSIIKI